MAIRLGRFTRVLVWRVGFIGGRGGGSKRYASWIHGRAQWFLVFLDGKTQRHGHLGRCAVVAGGGHMARGRVARKAGWTEQLRYDATYM